MVAAAASAARVRAAVASAVRGRGGFGRRPRPGGGPGGRDRSANFGPPAPPKRLRGAKKGSQQEHKPRGPIKERSGGRIYAVDDLEDDSDADLDNLAKLPADDEDAETVVETSAEDDTDDTEDQE